jgi:NTE family protein
MWLSADHSSVRQNIMRALVLSGGGNRGPLELGAARVLFESGFKPDLIVGTSAGAINGVFLAIDPTPAQTEMGGELGRAAGERRLFNGSPSRSLMRLLRGADYLTDNRKLGAYMRSVLPSNVRTFGDLRVPLYVVISHLASQTMFYYGDDPGADLIDAALLSAAVPGFFPPLVHNGHKFTDGGPVSNLPVTLAIARGATEIYAIDLGFEADPNKQINGSFAISGFCGSYLLHKKMLHELGMAMSLPGVSIHHVPIYEFQNVPLGDFSKVPPMIDAGERVMRAYLEQPQPNVVRHPRAFGPDDLPEGPPGARFFDPMAVLGRQ